MPRVGEAPPQIDARTPADFFEVITRAVFQSGFSWPVIAAKWEGFRAYLRSHGDLDTVSKDLQRRFTWLGALGAYYLLYVVQEPVPPFEEWRAGQGA